LKKSKAKKSAAKPKAAAKPKEGKSHLFQPGQSGNPARQWQPGQSGNPKGRPRLDKMISELLAEKRSVRIAVDDLPENMRKGKASTDGRVRVTMTAAEFVIRKVIRHAARGKGTFARILFDYNSGRPPQTIVHDGSIAVPVGDAREALASALAQASATAARRQSRPGA
jgi:hypothetical protein